MVVPPLKHLLYHACKKTMTNISETLNVLDFSFKRQDYRSISNFFPNILLYSRATINCNINLMSNSKLLVNLMVLWKKTNALTLKVDDHKSVVLFDLLHYRLSKYFWISDTCQILECIFPHT